MWSSPVNYVVFINTVMAIENQVIDGDFEILHMSSYLQKYSLFRKQFWCSIQIM